jgi:hypothetical protein
MKLPKDPQIQEAYAQLLLDDRMVFEHAYACKSKGLGAVYVAWLCGSHYAYLGRQDVQYKYWFSLGGLLIWALADLARIPGLVNGYNRNVALINLEPFKRKAAQQRALKPDQSQPVTLEPVMPEPVLAEPVLAEPLLTAPTSSNQRPPEAKPVESIPANQHAVIELVFQ